MLSAVIFFPVNDFKLHSIMSNAATTPNSIESAHDILHHTTRRPLSPIFSPQSVAVIGATENPGSVGRTILENLVKGGFPGKIFPVNPKRDTVLGVKAYPSITAVPENPDLAVIITPPPTVPGIIKDCGTSRREGRDHYFRRLQGNRRSPAWNWNGRCSPKPRRRACASSARIVSA